MGRVFTWSEVKGGRIPNPATGDFRRAKRELADRLEGTSCIRGGLFFGTATRDEVTRRSDIDCLVAVDASSMSTNDWNDLADVPKVLHHVEIGLEVVDVRSCHTIGPLIRSYLDTIGDEHVIGDDPRVYLPLHYTTKQRELQRYLEFKKRTLCNGIAYWSALNERERAEFLRKVSEVPLHVARKVMHLRRKLTDFSRRAVCEAYGDADDCPVATFDELIAADAVYSAVLDDQLETKKSVSSYLDAQDQLLNAAPAAISFLQENYELVSRMEC